MSQKKILIISLSAGAGHTQAANALLKTAKKDFPELECKHIDMYDFISYPFKKATVSSYKIITRTAPQIWGLLYEKTNSSQMVKNFNKLSGKLKKINARKFYQEIKNFNPDFIICTHFLPTDLILNHPSNFSLSAKIGTVITDYDLHKFWIVEKTNFYFVASEKIKWKILNHYNANKQEIKPENIIVSGIPVDPDFYETNFSKSQLKKQYKINNDWPVVLVLSGGQGLIEISEIVKILFQLKNINIIAIAGKNNHLKKKLEKISAQPNINLQIVGWTDEMANYFKISDVIVSKPGGLTTTECLVAKKPIVAISPIPGQEEANAHFILENNFGKIANSYEDIIYYTQEFLNKKEAIFASLNNSAQIIWENVLDQI